MKSALSNTPIVVVPFAAAITLTIMNSGEGNCRTIAQAQAVLSKAKQSEHADNLHRSLHGQKYIDNFGCKRSDEKYAYKRSMTMSRNVHEAHAATMKTLAG